MKQYKQTIILASQSPRRRQLLRTLKIKFRVIPANIREDLGVKFSVKKLKKVALDKAEYVAKRFKNGIVISADTVVVVKGKIYGKPKTLSNAKKMLKELSGTVQDVWTAVAMKNIEKNKVILGTCKSKIKMRILNDDEISYLANKNLDKAGGYGIQEDDKYLKVLGGSYTNIVGFPMELVKKMLKRITLP